MKQFIIIASLALACMVTPMYAQSNFGVEIGGIYNEATTSNVEVKPKLSYRLGGFVNYDDTWGSGIYFVKRGAKMSQFATQYAGYIQKMDVSMNYIELVPLSVSLKSFNLNQNITLTPVLSLFGSYGFSGNGTLTGIGEDNAIFEKKIGNVFKNEQFTNNNVAYSYKGFKSFDAGGKLGIDLTAQNKYIFRINWTVGVFNMSSYDKNLRTNSLDLSFGYLFK